MVAIALIVSLDTKAEEFVEHDIQDVAPLRRPVARMPNYYSQFETPLVFALRRMATQEIYRCAE